MRFWQTHFLWGGPSQTFIRPLSDIFLPTPQTQHATSDITHKTLYTYLRSTPPPPAPLPVAPHRLSPSPCLPLQRASPQHRGHYPAGKQPSPGAGNAADRLLDVIPPPPPHTGLRNTPPRGSRGIGVVAAGFVLSILRALSASRGTHHRLPWPKASPPPPPTQGGQVVLLLPCFSTAAPASPRHQSQPEFINAGRQTSLLATGLTSSSPLGRAT